MRKIDLIVVHCTATPEGREVTVADITRWHKHNGWSTIGYHYVILLNGQIETGRPEEAIGAHVSGKNANSIGIVYVGGTGTDNRPKNTLTEKQADALERVLRKMVAKYPDARIAGHNQFAPKACPSFSVPEYLRNRDFDEKNIYD